MAAICPSLSGGSAVYDAVHMRVCLPHLFDVIEFAHFRPEDMDDDVSRINDDPVALVFPFNPDFRHTKTLQAFLKFLCQCADLSGRSARGDNHVIRDCCLSSEVYSFYILCFISIQRLFDDRSQLFWTVQSGFISF